MINGLMYKDHDKYEFKLYLYDRHKKLIREIKDVMNRHYIAKMNGIHEFTFDIPYNIHTIINGEVEEAVNPNFYDIVPEMYLKLVIKQKSSSTHIKEDFYYIDSVTPTEDETGKKINQVTTYLSPYALKYKHLMFYEGVSSLEEAFNKTIGRKSMWTIGHIDAQVGMSGDYTKRRMIDVDNINLLDFFFELIEIFDAVPVFDTIQNKVNFYAYENSGEYTDLTISDEQYLKSIVVQPSYDNVVTRMYCYGADELNFRNINPTGVDYVEDFSYYMNIDPSTHGTLGQEQLGMSNELISALKLYQKDIDSVEGEFTDLLTEQEKAQRDLTNLQNGMDALQTEYKMLEDQLDILNSTNQDGQEVKDKKDEVARRIREQEGYIDSQEIELGYIKQQVETLKEEVDITNHLSDDLLIELDGFVKEHMWIDTTYIDEFDLYRDAKKKIKLLSQPLTTFEIDIVDLLKVGSAFNDWSKLRINNVVKLKHNDLEVDIEAKISQLEYNIDANELSLVISNDRYMIDGIGELKDLIDTTTSTSTQIDLNKIKWDKAVKTSTDIDNIIDAKWDDIKEKIEVGANNSVEIGRRGIIIRDSENPDNYLVANNGVLAITDDGGDTWKHAITSEGIVGERIYGKLGVFAKLRADQIIVGDNGERISDSVIGSADYWNEMANSVEDNLDAIESIGNTDIMTPKDKLTLEREYYQLTSRYINMIKDLDKESNPVEYQKLIEEYKKIQEVTEPLLENMDTTTKYDSRRFREVYKDYYNVEEVVTGIIAKDKNEKLNQVEKNVKNELEHFVETTVDPLEDYVNGNITMWFSDGIPTLNNYPANNWRESEYGDHIGDLYYDELWGNAYRFTKDYVNNVYSWEQIGDNSIINAMYLANQAKDTADGKRRVFVNTPYPPYDKGDLWTQGVNGHLMVANKDRASGEFDLSDWNRATKYTDDAKAIEAVQKAQDSLDKIYNITDDGVITRDEKIPLKREWDTIQAQYTENVMVAEKYGISYTTYKKAYEALYDMVTPILSNDDEYYSIDRAIFNAVFKDYYIQELGLEDRIYDKVEERANQYTDDKVGKFEDDLAELEENLTGFLDDLVITLMESKSLERSMEQVTSSAIELLSAASDIGISNTSEYRDFYIAVFGANGLKETIGQYINQEEYPIKVSEYEVDQITKMFEEAGRAKERLSEAIEQERDKQSQAIQQDYTEEKVKQLEKELSDELDKANKNLAKIAEDNYITKTESKMLEKDFESVSGQVMETIKMADNEGMINDTLRNQLFTETFGYEGLRGLLEPFINQESYPIELPEEDMEAIIQQGELVGLLQQQLLAKILTVKENKVLDKSKEYIDEVMGDFDGSVTELEDTINSIANDLVITKMESELLSKDLTGVTSGAFVIFDVADDLGLYSHKARKDFYNAIFGEYGLRDVLDKYINQEEYPVKITEVEIGVINSAFVEVSQTKEILQDIIEKTRSEKTLEQSIYYTSDQVNRLDNELSSELDLTNDTINSITSDLMITKMESAMLNKDLEGILGTTSELLLIADGLGMYENTKRQRFYASVFGFNGLKTILEKYIDQETYPIKVTQKDLDEINTSFREVAESKENLIAEIDKVQVTKIEDEYIDYVSDITKGLDDKIDLAQTTASNAQSVINSISNDNYITKMESESLGRELTGITSTAMEIINIADEMYLQGTQERKDYYNAVFGEDGLESMLKPYIDQSNYPIYISENTLKDINAQFKLVSESREALGNTIEKERDRLLSGEISGDLYELEKKTENISKIAEDAETTASLAKNTIDRIAEDNYITKMESKMLSQDLDGIKSTALEITKVADDLYLEEALERKNYYNSVFGEEGIVKILDKYIDSYYYPIYVSESELEDISKSFESVSKHREILVDKIETERNRLLNGEISWELYQLEKKTDGISEKADSAQDSADRAYINIRQISEDNYITKMESESLSRNLEEMKNTATEIIDVADSLYLNYSSERIGYYNSMYSDNGLAEMLTPYINKDSYPIYISDSKLKDINTQFGIVSEKRELLVDRIERERNRLLTGDIGKDLYELEMEIEGAKNTADRAEQTVNKISNDNYITKTESNALERDLVNVTATSDNIMKTARELGLHYTLQYDNYKDAVYGEDGLDNLLKPYLNQDNYPIYISDIELNKISKQFATVSDTREELVSLIERTRSNNLEDQINRELDKIIKDTEDVKEKAKDAEIAANNAQNLINMISEDSYITKTESASLDSDLTSVKQTATEILKIADELHLNTSSERVAYYNSIYGDDGLSKLLDKYIDSYYYPIYMSQADVEKIKKQFGVVAKCREELVGKIETERNRLLSGEISWDLYQLEKKTEDISGKAESANKAAKNAQTNIDKISNDNYITKMESEMLSQDLEGIMAAANEIIEIADDLYLNYSTERQNYYNSIYGDDKLKDTINYYLNRSDYPVYIFTEDIKNLNSQFKEVGKYRELLVGKIELERNRLLSGEISTELYEVEKKVNSAQSTANSAYSTIRQISEDNYITKIESEMLSQDLEDVIETANELIQIADSLGLRYYIERQNYYNSVFGDEGIKELLGEYIDQSYYPRYISKDDLNKISDKFGVVATNREKLSDKIITRKDSNLEFELQKDIERVEEITKNIKEVAEKAESTASSAQRLVNDIASDNYITKMESENLERELEEIKEASTEVLRIADDLYLAETNARRNYWNSIYGSGGLVELLDDYIDSYYHPIYISTANLQSINDKFVEVSLTKELLIDAIEKGRNRLLSGEISLEMYELEKKVESAKDTADRAKDTVNDIASDNYITKIESESLNQRLSEVTRTALELIEVADNLGLNGTPERSDYYNSVFGVYGISNILKPFINKSSYPIPITTNQLNDINSQFGIVAKNREILADKIMTTKDNIVIDDVEKGIKELEESIKNIAKDGAITEQNAKLLEAQYSTMMNDIEKTIDQVERLAKVNLLPSLKSSAWDVSSYAQIKGDYELDIVGTTQAWSSVTVETIIGAEYRVGVSTGQHTPSDGRAWWIVRENNNDGDTYLNYAAPPNLDSKGFVFTANTNKTYFKIGKRDDTSKAVIKDMFFFVELDIDKLKQRKDELNKILQVVTNANSYPVEVNDSWADDLLMATNNLLNELKDVNLQIDAAIESSLKNDSKHYTDSQIKEEVPKLIDMNPDLIRASRKYSDVQITKEKGIVASHTNGEYTQLDGSGLIRYVPHPEFESKPTYKEGWWREKDGEETQNVFWNEGQGSGSYRYEPQRETITGGGMFYATSNNFMMLKGYANGRDMDIKLNGVSIYSQSTIGSSNIDDKDREYFSTSRRAVNKGWNSIEWTITLTTLNYHSGLQITDLMYDSNIHQDKLVGWKNTGYKYGYRTHVGEAVSNEKHPAQFVRIQLPMDFVMDAATYGQGFDVFLAVKEYSKTYTTEIQPVLHVLDKDYSNGTFTVRAYVTSKQASGSERFKETPLHFTYIAIARK